MIIHRLQGLTGAERATGPTAVVDTFRAFTTAAYAHDGNIAQHFLVESIDDARRLSAVHPGALLCGEVEGVTPDDFDLGNSPAEVLAMDLEGRTLIQRTSAGTRSVLRALDSGKVGTVHPASLAVATATARAMASVEEVSLVASGRFGIEPVIEDDLTCDFIDAILSGAPPPQDVTTTLRASQSAERLESSPWTHPDDVLLCTRLDTFDFFLTATRQPDGYAKVHRTPA